MVGPILCPEHSSMGVLRRPVVKKTQGVPQRPALPFIQSMVLPTGLIGNTGEGDRTQSQTNFAICLQSIVFVNCFSRGRPSDPSGHPPSLGGFSKDRLLVLARLLQFERMSC